MPSEPVLLGSNDFWIVVIHQRDIIKRERSRYPPHDASEGSTLSLPSTALPVWFSSPILPPPPLSQQEMKIQRPLPIRGFYFETLRPPG